MMIPGSPVSFCGLASWPRRCLPPSPSSVEGCPQGLISRVMRSSDGIDFHGSVSPLSNWCYGRDSCNDPWCSINMTLSTRANWIVRGERDTKWNINMKIIILDMWKSSLYIRTEYRASPLLCPRSDWWCLNARKGTHVRAETLSARGVVFRTEHLRREMSSHVPIVSEHVTEV